MTLFGAIAIGVVIGFIGGVVKHFLDPEDGKKPNHYKSTRNNKGRNKRRVLLDCPPV